MTDDIQSLVCRSVSTESLLNWKGRAAEEKLSNWIIYVLCELCTSPIWLTIPHHLTDWLTLTGGCYRSLLWWWTHYHSFVPIVDIQMEWAILLPLPLNYPPPPALTAPDYCPRTWWVIIYCWMTRCIETHWQRKRERTSREQWKYSSVRMRLTNELIRIGSDDDGQ